MKRFGVLLTSCAMLVCPAILSAQNATLEICNKGPITINVAYAARIQLFLTGYRWETGGWYSVDPAACKTVYDQDYSDAGPFTPQSGARVAIVAETGGTWRAFHNTEVDKNGWMQSGTGQICADIGNSFGYNEPAGDPAANCTGGTLMPVAFDFMPTGPGDYSYTINWDGRSSSVAVGKSASSTSLAAATSSGPGTTYFCTSTDRQKVVFVSDVFPLSDNGSQADNFLTFQRMQIRFHMFLINHYDFQGDDGTIACVHAPTTATSFAEMSAKERSFEASIAAANKHIIQTGWKYVAEDVASDSTVHFSVTRGDVATLTPVGRAELFTLVSKDVAKYLAASKNGFDAYKSGDVIVQQGLRMWTSSVKPEIARGCWVVQGDSSTTLSCTIPIDSNYERAYYNELVQDVGASLPAGWSVGPPNPFGGSLPSAGFTSTSGAHGEVWLTEPTDATYELNFQLVSGPIRH